MPPITANQISANRRGRAQQQPPNTNSSRNSQRPADTDNAIVSCHEPWPDLQFNQSPLFFECTLFLYSVLALFLQYLNIYKTLWWLPKSHWHSSMKYHMINPYILSCIGLLLGLRVTKCFWNTITDRIGHYSKDSEGMHLIGWKVFEYSFVKTPLVTIISTSFLFSMTRIYAEFSLMAILLYSFPFIVFLLLFKRQILLQMNNALVEFIKALTTMKFYGEADDHWDKFSDSFDRIGTSQALIDLENVGHACSDAERTREEASILLADVKLRLKNCIFIGFFMAYFSIGMPRFLVAQKTASNEAQFVFISDMWVAQLAGIVFLTGTSMCFTSLFPINYLDLLYRCARHLGCWEKVDTQPQSFSQYQSGNHFYLIGKSIVHNSMFYVAKSRQHDSSSGAIAAEPENHIHLQFYQISNDPIRTLNYMCIFQALFIAVQFWLLLLTTDWQHIVTLVLLMFANYLLLAKVFKDRVLIGRIYHPNREDTQLLKQLEDEHRMQI